MTAAQDAGTTNSTDTIDVTVVSSFADIHGGSEQWLVSALRHTDRLRVRAVLLAEGPLADVLADAGADVVTIPTGTNALAIVHTAKALAHDLRTHRPQVVLGNGVKAQAALALPARVLGIPAVWVKHDHSFDRVLAAPLARLSSQVVATAAEVGEATRRSDVVIIEPERPSEPLPRDAALDILAGYEYVPDSRPSLVMIGRLVPYKGVDVAIASLAYAAAADWRLVVIGADDPATPGESERLRQLAQDLGVADRVEFLGGIPTAGRLVRAFSALAALTRPGQANAPQREGYGITATEAMLGAVPVIVAGRGPIARRLATPAGPAGVVVRPADPLATAAALGRLGDATSRAAMGARGRAAAIGLPDAEVVSAAVVDVLERAVQGDPSRAHRGGYG